MKIQTLVCLILLCISHVSFAQEEEKPKKKRTFKQAISIGVNYQFIKSPSSELSSAFSNIEFDAKLEDFGFSFYAPIGFFFSNYRNKKEDLPNYFYDENILEGARDILNKNSISFQDTHSPVLHENIKSFSTGLYLAPFFRVKVLKYIHFMTGINYTKGTTWTNYEGNLNPTLNYSYSNKNAYAVDKAYYDDISFIGGLALVFPFIQIEGGYDFQFETIFFNGGLNIPFQVLMKKD